MPIVCIKCVKDSHLKQLIKNEGAVIDCTICGEASNKAIDSDNSNFFELAKAVLRFHYSEWDYNHHLGGDGYESMFYGEDNIFFNIDRSNSDDAYEELVLSITEGPAYEDYDKGVSVFSGYDKDGAQNMPLRSIKSSLDRNLLMISEKLKSENYFQLEDHVKAVLNDYKNVAEKMFSSGYSFYRARIGVEDKKRYLGLGFESENHYKPFSNSEIGSPPPYIASAGRINRPGVSFFYCATDIYTAISEVRPHPGDHVSIGKFYLRSDVKLFDLSDSQLIHFYESDEMLDKYIPFNTLTVLINKVVPPSERQHYSVTQLIADCIRQIGFDGIIFSSTVGDGDNIVIFDEQILDYTEDEKGVVKIQAVKYDFISAPLIEDGGFYR